MSEPMRPELLPKKADLRRAVTAYLRHAYPAGRIPAAVQQRVEQLESAEDVPWQEDVFEKTQTPAGPRYALRLGNAAYPHMKLAIEPTPDNSAMLFCADTHDRHIRPAPGSRDYDEFIALQKRNAEIAAAIESSWSAGGLLTFKDYLRRDLQRRAAGGA